jgi:MFS family permease
MWLKPPERPRFRLSHESPQGGRALLFGALWLTLGGLAAWGAVYLAVHLTWFWALRLIPCLLLIAISGAALMLASDSAQRGLGNRGGWAGVIHWLTTSFVALAVVVVIGAPVTLLAPDRPGRTNLLWDFLFDLGIGLVGGLAAAGLVGLTGLVLGGAILFVQNHLGLQARAKKRWRRPGRNRGQVRRELLRAMLIGLAGLMLSAACTAIVTTVTTNHNGAVDGAARPIETNVGLTVILPVFVWFVATSIVWWFFAVWHRRRGVNLDPHPRLRHGTHATALGLCGIIVMVWVFSAGIEHKARSELWRGGGPVPTVPITDQQASTASPYLAQQFEPKAWLTADEKWDPTSVAWYLRHNPTANHDPPLCSSGAGCYEISKACDGSEPRRCARSGANDPALYYRYVTAASDGNDKLSSDAVRDWTLIQYWFFYNYDSLQAGAITQWHQSDWEQVSVLVRRTGRGVTPVEVAYSEHCYGAVVPAERVWWVNRSHPVTFVASGSHGNYPRPVSVPVRQLRCSLGVTPRYLGVAGLFFSSAFDGSRLEIPFAYLIGLRDRTARARPEYGLRLLSLDKTPAIESFTGFWGLDNNLSPFDTFRLRASAGPPAPQTQGPWRTPFGSMLCSDRWLGIPAHPPSETAWICAES